MKEEKRKKHNKGGTKNRNKNKEIKLSQKLKHKEM